MKKYFKVCPCLPLVVFVLTSALTTAMAEQGAASSGALAYKGASEKPGGVKSLEKRLKQLEDAVTREAEGDKWYDRIQISGLVEVEAAGAKTDYKDPSIKDERTGDIDLAVVELGVDAKLNKHAHAHVLFKYEDEDLFVDEGHITLVGPKELPAYLIAGKQYLPFGNFDSHFVTDPTTLELGETIEGAAVGGIRAQNKFVDFSLGVFNGKTDKAQNIADNKDHTDNVVGSLVFKRKESAHIGVSYTSNLAAADSFSVSVSTNGIKNYVGGWSAFVSIFLVDRVRFIGEYVSALESFQAGELYAATDLQKRRPEAWSTELGWEINRQWEVAARYAGSKDGDAGGGEFLPQKEFGGIVNWTFAKKTNLALEYMRRESSMSYEKSNVVTAQLAVEF